MHLPEANRYLSAAFNFLTLVLLLVSSTPGYSQSSPDSPQLLREQINQSPDDTTKVRLYDDLFLQFFMDKQHEDAQLAARQGLQLAERLSFPSGIALMNYRLAIALNAAGNSTEALDFFQAALEEMPQLNDPYLEAKIRLNRGTSYYFLGDLDFALEDFLAANVLCEELNKKEEHARLLNNIGIIYRLQEKYARAREIYEQSYVIKKELNDTSGMAASLQNIGLLYSYQADSNETGLRYLLESLQLYEQLDSERDVAGCLTAIGDSYLRLNEWQKGKEYMTKAWQYYQEQPEHEYTISAVSGLGEIAIHEKDWLAAENYFQQALVFARSLQQRQKILGILNYLSIVQHQLGKDASAYTALREAYALQDTLNDETRLAAMEEMQTRFDVRQKEAELKISQLELSERTRQRNALRLGAILLGCLAVLIFFGLRSRIRINQKIADQRAELQRQRIKQLEQEKKMAALHAMLEGQEQERSRIANDLHDGLGGLLSAVKSHFGASIKEPGNQDLQQTVNQLIDNACGEVHRISHNMMPRILSLSGLHGAIESLAQQLQRGGLDCELEMIGLKEAELSDTKATSIYRIIQELANNVVKHADAKSLFLQIIQREGNFTIIVEDDGCGFSVEEALQKDGLGLASIAARVEHLHGSIHWDSVPGEGTTVSLSV